MSFLTSRTSALRPFLSSAAAHPRIAVAKAALSTSAARRVGKESAVHQGSDRAEEVDALKKQQQQEAKQGTNTWKHDLASDSEANLKADQQGKHSKEDAERLQKETAGKR